MPAIIYQDADNPSLYRLITVVDGQAYYQSTGMSELMSGLGKEPGAFYRYYGHQVESTAFGVGEEVVIARPGRLIKWGEFEGGQLQSVPELYDYSYTPTEVTSS